MKIALLRGINLGSTNKVAMAELRALMEGLGAKNVKTLLNSGNVVFEGALTAKKLEGALDSELGVSCRVMVIDAATLDAILDENPLGDVATSPSKHVVGVVARASDLKKAAPLVEEDWGDEAIAIGEHAIYTWHPHGIHASKLAKAVGKALGDALTARNWATMEKLRAAAQR